MINKEELLDIQNGFRITDDNGNDTGPILTGGAVSPLGIDFPTDTLYVQNKTDGLAIWRKFGNGINDWTIYDGSVRCDELDHDLTIPTNTVKLLAPRKVNGCIKLDGRIKVI